MWMHYVAMGVLTFVVLILMLETSPRNFQVRTLRIYHALIFIASICASYLLGGLFP